MSRRFSVISYFMLIISNIKSLLSPFLKPYGFFLTLPGTSFI